MSVILVLLLSILCAMAFPVVGPPSAPRRSPCNLPPNQDYDPFGWGIRWFQFTRWRHHAEFTLLADDE